MALFLLIATGCSAEERQSGSPPEAPRKTTATEAAPPPETTAERPPPAVTTQETTRETTQQARAAGTEPPEAAGAKTVEAAPGPFARYERYTIEGLRGREYGAEGGIKVLQVLEENAYFTRYLISYPSDGLTITGFMNVPVGEGPFPVVVASHGYQPLDTYVTGDGSRLASDYFATSGFLVLSPDFRSHAGSDDAPNVFRTGHVVEALNLAALGLKLPRAAGEKVGLWGHSNGGAVTAKAMTVAPDLVGAAVVYAPASSNLAEDYYFKAERRASRGEGVDTAEWPVQPEEAPDLYGRLSPLPYLRYVEAPVQIHWGTNDDTVPYKWPGDLLDGLNAAGKDVTYFEYPGQPHSFQGSDNDLYLQRSTDFFAQSL